MKYAIAYISFFDNVQHISFVEASNEVEAIRTWNKNLQDEEKLFGDFNPLGSSLEEIQTQVFDCDGAIGVKAVE